MEKVLSLQHLFREDIEPDDPVGGIFVAMFPFDEQHLETIAKAVFFRHEFRIDYVTEFCDEKSLFEFIDGESAVFFSITSSFFSDDNPAKTILLPYVKEHNIPAVFLLQEEGLAERFVQSFGPLYFLDLTHKGEGQNYVAAISDFLSALSIPKTEFEKITDSFAHHVYVSYAREDRDIVHPLAKELGDGWGSNTIGLFYDGVTQTKHRSMEEQIDFADCFVIVLTRSSLSGETFSCEYEYPYAKKQGKRILFLLFDNMDESNVEDYYPGCLDIIDARDDCPDIYEHGSSKMSDESRIRAVLANGLGIESVANKWPLVLLFGDIRCGNTKAWELYVHYHHQGTLLGPDISKCNDACEAFLESEGGDDWTRAKIAIYWRIFIFEYENRILDENKAKTILEPLLAKLEEGPKKDELLSLNHLLQSAQFYRNCRYPEAEAEAKLAEGIASRNNGPLFDFYLFRGLSLQAKIAFEANQLDKAESLYKRAYETYRATKCKENWELYFFQIDDFLREWIKLCRVIGNSAKVEELSARLLRDIRLRKYANPYLFATLAEFYYDAGDWNKGLDYDGIMSGAIFYRSYWIRAMLALEGSRHLDELQPSHINPYEEIDPFWDEKEHSSLFTSIEVNDKDPREISDDAATSIGFIWSRCLNRFAKEFQEAYRLNMNYLLSSGDDEQLIRSATFYAYMVIDHAPDLTPYLEDLVWLFSLQAEAHCRAKDVPQAIKSYIDVMKYAEGLYALDAQAYQKQLSDLYATVAELYDAIDDIENAKLYYAKARELRA